MKRIIEKAVWCLPLAALLGLMAYFIKMIFPAAVIIPAYPPGDDSFPLASFIHATFHLTYHLLVFAGIMALVMYVIERTNLVQATYALVLLFAGNCTDMVLVMVAHLLRGKEETKALMAIKIPAVNNFMHSFAATSMAADLISMLSIVGTLLLLYCLFKTRLFARWVLIAYLTSLVISFLIAVTIPLFTGHLPPMAGNAAGVIAYALTLAAYFGFAANTKFPVDAPPPTEDIMV